MLGDLVFTENAYFYNKLKKISRTKLETVFTEISRKRDGNYILNEIKKNTAGATYSICVFKYKEKPSFIDNDVLKETKFAYLLVVEYEDYVVINKKSIPGLDKQLKDFIHAIDYNIISKVFLSDDTNFEKLTLQNMDISNNVVRRKSMEAINLKESMSALGVNKYMVNQLRLANRGDKFSLSLNTSRINQLGKKVDLDYYLEWVKEICTKIKSFSDKETFMDNFSIPLSFEEYIDRISPRGFLFLTSEIQNQFDNDNIQSVRYLDKEIDFLRYIKRYYKSLEIEARDVGGENIFLYKTNLIVR
ncbi:hypothetical protein [Paenibacillus lactis]|uniref:hypothetical protein n=1 Tax=Paenibacillus lactis TaxID=228574 RepID=UPI003D752D9F